nr:SMP-30/gluconolactonase/LRE family protein [Actinoalloteichus caeruleus]
MVDRAGAEGLGVTETTTCEVAVAAQAVLGAAPTWDASADSLLWVDSFSQEVHRYQPARDQDDVLSVPQIVSAARPRSRGGIVTNLRDGVALIDTDNTRTWLVYWARDGVRGGEAAVDPSGRLWATTTRADGGGTDGWLVSVEPDGAARVALHGVGLGAGLGWSPDWRLMYFVDATSRRIDVFDFDASTGALGNRREFRAFDRSEGLPGGIAVDAEGCVWVTMYGAGSVRRHTPDGAFDREFRLPVSRPTACAFGGIGFTDLYVTSARHGMGDQQLADEPEAGSLLVLPDVGAGQPSTVFPG